MSSRQSGNTMKWTPEVDALLLRTLMTILQPNGEQLAIVVGILQEYGHNVTLNSLRYSTT